MLLSLEFTGYGAALHVHGTPDRAQHNITSRDIIYQNHTSVSLSQVKETILQSHHKVVSFDLHLISSAHTHMETVSIVLLFDPAVHGSWVDVTVQHTQYSTPVTRQQPAFINFSPQNTFLVPRNEHILGLDADTLLILANSATKSVQLRIDIHSFLRQTIGTSDARWLIWECLFTMKNITHSSEQQFSLISLPGAYQHIVLTTEQLHKQSKIMYQWIRDQINVSKFYPKTVAVDCSLKEPGVQLARCTKSTFLNNKHSKRFMNFHFQNANVSNKSNKSWVAAAHLCRSNSLFLPILRSKNEMERFVAFLKLSQYTRPVQALFVGVAKMAWLQVGAKFLKVGEVH